MNGGDLALPTLLCFALLATVAACGLVEHDGHPENYRYDKNAGVVEPEDETTAKLKTPAKTGHQRGTASTARACKG